MPAIPGLPTRLAHMGLGNTLDIAGVALIVAGLAALVGQVLTPVFDSLGADLGVLAFWDFLVFSFDRSEPVVLSVIGLLALLLAQATARPGRSMPSGLIRLVCWSALLVFGFSLVAAVSLIARIPSFDVSVGYYMSNAVKQVALAAGGGLLAVVMLARPVRPARAPQTTNHQTQEA